MLGKTRLQISFCRFSEKRIRKFRRNPVEIVPRFGLRVQRVDFAVNEKSEPIGSRKLRIFRIARFPLMQRLVRPIYARQDRRIGCKQSRANGIITEFIVDTEIAHFHAPEIFIAGRGNFERFELMLAELRYCRRLRRRRFFRRRRR